MKSSSLGRWGGFSQPSVVVNSSLGLSQPHGGGRAHALFRGQAPL